MWISPLFCSQSDADFSICQNSEFETDFSESEQIWNFLYQLIWPNSSGNPEDSGNDVGDFFAHKVMQIPNLETVFESEQIWNFLYHATP